MSYKRSSLDYHSGQSLLGRAAYNSLSPAKRRQTERLSSFDSPMSRKFNYLSDVSNQNQSILKEMFSMDAKYAKTRQVPSHSVAVTKINELPNYGFNSKPNRMQREMPQRLQELPQQSETPQKFIKSQVRNRSFDPILGREKMYETPAATFNALGTNGGDLYKLNGQFRNHAPTGFQNSLRN